MGLAFLITTENLQLLSERKVLKEAEYAALLDATQVLAVAQDEARRVAEQAEAAAAEREREGYEEGLQRARADAAGRLVSEALAVQRELLALRESMAGIVVKAIGQFMADADPDALLQAALQRVDALIRREPFITVHVAPSQEARVAALVERLRLEAQWTMAIGVQADAALADEACVLHTASGTLEIGLDAQLEAIRRAVERG